MENAGFIYVWFLCVLDFENGFVSAVKFIASTGGKNCRGWIETQTQKHPASAAGGL